MLSLTRGEDRLLQQAADNCPYLCSASCTCAASFSTLPISARKNRELCSSEDFDDCALFLSRLLRRTQPRYGLDPWTIQDK